MKNIKNITLNVGLGIDTNFTIRFDFDSILIIVDISYNKWQIFSGNQIS